MRITVDVPTDDVRRERVERATFARLDAIRAALAVPDDAARRDRIETAVFREVAEARSREHVAYALRPRRRWMPIAGFAVAAAAAVVLVVALRGGEREPIVSQHVVPAGEHAHWTFGDAVIDAAGGTTVDERLDDTGVTLTLAHGKVDCVVEPRSGRTPFRVVAGEVTVIVVGTQFAVERIPSGVRVAVTHGKVRVRVGDKETLLTNGESWSSPITAGATPVTPGAVSSASNPPTTDPGIDEADIDMSAPDLPAKPAAKQASAKDLFDDGAALERRRDFVRAAKRYREAASTRDPKYAAVALYSLVDVEHKRGANASALRAIDEYLKRFKSGVAVEELLWLRVDIYRATGNTAQMNTAARAYLDRFPAGTYARQVRNRIGE